MRQLNEKQVRERAHRTHVLDKKTGHTFVSGVESEHGCFCVTAFETSWRERVIVVRRVTPDGYMENAGSGAFKNKEEAVQYMMELARGGLH